MIIVGAGDFGRELRDWVYTFGGDFAGFLDDEKEGEQILGDTRNTPILQLAGYMMGIANPQAREAVQTRLMVRGARFVGWAHQTVVSDSATTDMGLILCPNAVVSGGARIGRFVHVNIGSSVGHDVEVGDFCTISSHVDLCGRVVLGRRVFVGSHATILPGVKVGDDAVIGAGCVVVKDVPEGVTMYSAPARRLG